MTDPEELRRQEVIDQAETHRIDIVAVYNLIRTLIIIVLICTTVVCAGMVAIVTYNRNTRGDTKVTKEVACNTAHLIHGRAPEYVIPKECQ